MHRGCCHESGNAIAGPVAFSFSRFDRPGSHPPLKPEGATTNRTGAAPSFSGFASVQLTQESSALRRCSVPPASRFLQLRLALGSGVLSGRAILSFSRTAHCPPMLNPRTVLIRGHFIRAKAGSPSRSSAKWSERMVHRAVASQSGAKAGAPTRNRTWINGLGNHCSIR